MSTPNALEAEFEVLLEGVLRGDPGAWHDLRALLTPGLGALARQCLGPATAPPEDVDRLVLNMLERLRDADFRRLRGFASQRSSARAPSLQTWLLRLMRPTTRSMLGHADADIRAFVTSLPDILASKDGVRRQAALRLLLLAARRCARACVWGGTKEDREDRIEEIASRVVLRLCADGLRRLREWNAKERTDPVADFRAWLYTVTHHVVIDVAGRAHVKDPVWSQGQWESVHTSLLSAAASPLTSKGRTTQREESAAQIIEAARKLLSPIQFAVLDTWMRLQDPRLGERGREGEGKRTIYDDILVDLSPVRRLMVRAGLSAATAERIAALFATPTAAAFDPEALDALDLDAHSRELATAYLRDHAGDVATWSQCVRLSAADIEKTRRAGLAKLRHAFRETAEGETRRER